jgi:TPR repeat protein
MMDEAISWFRKGDAQGLMISTHNLACKLYEKGEEKEGRSCFEKAAKANYPSSLYYMGVIFERENDCRGTSCYRKAAQLGNEKARQALVDLKIDFIIDMMPLDMPINF